MCRWLAYFGSPLQLELLLYRPKHSLTVIVGQTQEYMIKQLNDYAGAARKNDVYGRMRDISRKLTPQERADLARYFQGTL